MRKPTGSSRRGILVLAVSTFFLTLFGPGASGEDRSSQQSLLLISLDGFRADYLEKTETPNLHRLASQGIRAQALIPAFPSETFPNHYTIVTGLYPEHHGIISNVMFDPVFKDTFRLGKVEAVTDGRWWGGEPIWVTARKQGHIAATFFWPGSEAEIQGFRPNYWKTFDSTIPYQDRIKQVLEWLSLPEPERPSFVTLYIDLTDRVGHASGPDSPEMLEAIRLVDATLGNLLNGLEQTPESKSLNLLIVSDHGMTELSPERVIYPADYLDLAEVEVVDWSPNFALIPRTGKEEDVYTRLLHAHPHLKVYRKEEIPERFHYRENRRIAPILAMADEGWQVRKRGPLDAAVIQSKRGGHGYDNALPSMAGIFLACGPAFEKGIEVESFESVHLYNLMCAILGMNPAPNDGNMEAVKGWFILPER
jgi:predicted AlkP superfamily pyrophosphatase or phosphodiesterase